MTKISIRTKRVVESFEEEHEITFPDQAIYERWSKTEYIAIIPTLRSSETSEILNYATIHIKYNFDSFLIKTEVTPTYLIETNYQNKSLAKPLSYFIDEIVYRGIEMEGNISKSEFISEYEIALKLSKQLLS